MKRIFLFLIAFLILTSACSREKPDVRAFDGDVKEFRITARQFAFEPETIEITKGDRVRLIVTSVDVSHGLSIPEYGINERINPGQPVAIEFVAGKEGNFTF